MVEYLGETMPEIPENVGALTKLTEAATENIISILTSHNPRLRPRFDRFDVAISFRPSSNIYFDANDVQTPRHSSCCVCWNQVKYVDDCSDSRYETTTAYYPSCFCFFSQSTRRTDVAALRRSTLNTLEEFTAHNIVQNSVIVGDHQIKRVVDGFEENRAEKPKRRMLDRLLRCFGSSRNSD
jgi:hypothetical protein